MAGSTVGALRVTLGANTANFEAGMKRARREAATSATAIQRSLGGIKAGVVGLATGLISGAVIGGIISLTKRSLEYAGSLGETAQQLGVTTEALQVYRYAGSQVGITQEEMDTSLKKLSDSIAEAGQGSKAQAEAFNELGVNVKLANGELKSTDRVIREMADGFAKLKNPADQVRLGIDLMGRAGSKMVPLLSGGSKAIDGLAEAAHKLGIVLSEEQIRNADKVADRLESVKRVLEARIAGVVSDNASAIYDLADALASLANVAVKAAGAYLQLLKLLGGGNAAKGLVGAALPPIGAVGIIQSLLKAREEAANRAHGVSVALPPPAPAPRGATGLNRIAGGGGGKRGGGGRDRTAELERQREQAVRRIYEQDRELSDAKADELDAQKDLLSDYVDRAAIDHELIDIEADQRDKSLDLTVALAKIDGTYDQQLQNNVDLLKASSEHLRILKKQAVDRQVELDRQHDFNRLEDVVFDIQRDELQARSALAETAAERRKVELEILDVAYKQKQADIDRLAASEDWADQEEARRRQAALPGQRAADTAGVMAGTRGPWEDYLNSLPNSAAKVTESLEEIKVRGINGVIDGLVEMSQNWQNAGQIAKSVIQSIISDLLRLKLQQLAVSLLGGGGGLQPGDITGMMAANPGIFANGGYTGNMPTSRIAGVVHGREYVFDAAAVQRIGAGNLEALRRGTLRPANDTRHGDTFAPIININARMTGRERRETVSQAAVAFQRSVAVAKRNGL